MITFETKAIDNSTETRISTAMIISTKFISEVSSVFNPNYIRNSFCKIICVWCLDYYKKYKQAPGLHIQDIYLVEKEMGLPKEDAELISNLLGKLSKEYSEGQGINSDFYRDEAYKYFRKRELEIRVESAQKLLTVDRVDEADAEFSKYKKIAYQTSGWFNPFDKREILEVFNDTDEGIFRFPGALGKIIGPVERDWFIALLAPFKRGKSWFLQEIGVWGLFQGLKVVFISLEMKKKNLKERFYKRMTAFGSRTGEDVFLFPIFDCLLNQQGSCLRRERTNQIRLLSEDGRKPLYDVNMEYRVCTYCRDHYLPEYRSASWFDPIEVPPFELRAVQEHMLAEKNHYGDNIRFMSYPRFCAGIDDIKRDLQILEQHDNFVPDMVLVDYADILKLPQGDRRNQIDDVWKMLASMAAERHCMMFTASQGTRGSIYKSDMSQDDLAEWIGKLGHVDIFMGLNQSIEEKDSKVIRVNLLVHRHKDFNEQISAMLLQQLEVGQFALDSEITRRY